MSIPTKLTIYVPNDNSRESIALRTELRAAVRTVCVGPRESFPSGEAWAKACRAFFDAHPGLLGVLTSGGTAVLRSMSSLGDHELRVQLPSQSDYDHYQEAAGAGGVAEVRLRRGGRWDKHPAAKVRGPPPPSYSVGQARYEDEASPALPEFDARGLLLGENGANKLSVRVFLWSKNPGHGRTHIVVLKPGEAEGRTLCDLQRKVRPYGDPFTSGDETSGAFARDACPACRQKAREKVHGGRPTGGR